MHYNIGGQHVDLTYFFFTGSTYDGEVYIFYGIDAIPLCEPKARKNLKLLLFLLLLLPMSKIMVDLIDELTPDPPIPPTTTPAPTVPPTPSG